PIRALTIVIASCSLRGSRLEPVLYADVYFAPTLARNSSAEPISCSNVAERLPDHFGAKDSRSFLRSGRKKAMAEPNFSIAVPAYVRPPCNVNWGSGVNHRKSRSTPFDTTCGSEVTTNEMPVNVLSWKFS